MSVDDETVAEWSREQNRGVPAWESLDDEARAWWRMRYALRNWGAE